MALDNVKFKIVSLNARGLRSLTERKAIMMWLQKQKADIAFLQETYSTKDVENIWRSQWNGSLFFSHRTEHARGVLVYVRKDLDFQLKNLHTDANGRFILSYKIRLFSFATFTHLTIPSIKSIFLRISRIFY